MSLAGFSNFADVHATMKRNKGKAFVVRIPKTAKPMEVQAFHNLQKIGLRRRGWMTVTEARR
jgi:hypothetical protein